MVATNKKRERKHTQALKWAKIAEKAWKKYFKISSDFYSTHVWYDRALGVQEHFEEMEVALKIAADLIMKPCDFFEFEEVRVEAQKLTVHFGRF
jgi:hypothetical protein